MSLSKSIFLGGASLTLDQDPFSDGSQIGYYNFDLNVNNQVPTGFNNGSANNLSYSTTKIRGTRSGDFEISGGGTGSTYIDIGSPGQSLVSRSVSLWVRFESTATRMMLIDGGDRPSTAYAYGSVHLDFRGNESPQRLIGVFAKYNGAQYGSISVDWSPSTGTWYHIVHVSTANGHRIYINGSNYTNGSSINRSSDSPTSYNSSVRVGGDKRYGSPQEEYDGLIDELRFFSKALSSSEVSTLYNGGSGFQG